MKVGDRVSATRIYRARDAAGLVALVGVEVVVDGFVPEPLVSGLLASLSTEELSGPGSVCWEQDLQFLRPVLVGEPVTAMVEVTEIDAEAGLIDLAATCADASGELLCEGVIVVKLAELTSR